MLDLAYQDPTFTDKYLLCTDMVNMRTQAARASSQKGGVLRAKNNGLGSIQRREQELLDIQELLLKKGKKEEILARMDALLEKVRDFELRDYAVIGKERHTQIMPAYNTYTLQKETPPEKRKHHFEQTRLTIYDGFRHTWWMFTVWNSEVVKQHMYDNMFASEKYAHVDDLFTGEQADRLFVVLKKTDPEATSNEEISKLVGDQLAEDWFLATKQHAWLPEYAIDQITKQLIKVYHQAKKHIAEQKHTFSTYFNNAYSPKNDIKNDLEGQQRMVASYEQMFGKETLAAYAKKIWKTYTDETKRAIVRKFASETVQQNALHGALTSAYHDLFFDLYLPTQQIITGTTTSSTGTWWPWSTVNTYAYTDKTEELLADIIWAGHNNLSDTSVSNAIDIGVNIALSLIPVVGTEVAVARLAGFLTARWLMTVGSISGKIATLGMRAVIGHTFMTSFSGMSQGNSMGEIRENLTDRQEFSQNAVFFTVIWQLGPWIKTTIGKINPRWVVTPEILTAISGHWLTTVWAVGLETGVIETSRSLLDPAYERNWHEVITVFMLGTILQSKIGNSIKEYTAIKTPDGTIKLVPISTSKFVAKIETRTHHITWLHRKREQQLLAATSGEEIHIMGQKVIKNVENGVTTYILPWEITSRHGHPPRDYKVKTTKELFTYLQGKKFHGQNLTKSEQIGHLRAEELEHQIDYHVRKGTLFRHEKNTYMLQIDDTGSVRIMIQESKGMFVVASEKEIQNIMQAKYSAIEQAAHHKLYQQLLPSRATLSTLWEKWVLSKDQFMQRCRTHNISCAENMLVGDFFRLLGEQRFGKLFLGQLLNFKWWFNAAYLVLSWKPLTAWRGLVLKNASTLFTIGSIVYGGLGWDDNEKDTPRDRDEAIENYILYGVIWRHPAGKILLAAVDSSDVII